MTRESIGETLAAVNALLNSTSAVLLLCGWLAIRRHNIQLHRRCMVSAFAVSALFLVSYLTRVFLTGAHNYPGHGVLRLIYFSLLSTHMLLAMAVPPLAITALYLATKNRIAAHRKVVRFAFPIWMYVSVTGVVVYLLLYHGPR